MALDIYPLTDGATDRARLGFLQRMLRPATLSLFDRVGVGPGMTCLDLGCGTGEATFDLARLVGPDGRVVGMDIDDARLGEAREHAEANGLTNVECRVSDIRAAEVADRFDLVYARFLLSHLSDPASVLAKMSGLVNPGGVVAVEDIDYSGYYCHPDLPAFRRCIEILYEMKRVLGASAEMGKELPSMFLDAGLSRVEVRNMQYSGLTGETKRFMPMSLAAGMGDWIVALDLTTEDEMRSIRAELNEFADNSRTVMGTPRFCQVWGYAQDG